MALLDRSKRLRAATLDTALGTIFKSRLLCMAKVWSLWWVPSKAFSSISRSFDDWIVKSLTLPEIQNELFKMVGNEWLKNRFKYDFKEPIKLKSNPM